MIDRNDIQICKEYKLMNDQNILYWMDNSHIFYYSCENCIKCNKCKKFSRS